MSKKIETKILNRWAELVGVKRKWLGLESNTSLRKRIVRKELDRQYIGVDEVSLDEEGKMNVLVRVPRWKAKEMGVVDGD